MRKCLWNCANLNRTISRSRLTFRVAAASFFEGTCKKKSQHNWNFYCRRIARRKNRERVFVFHVERLTSMFSCRCNCNTKCAIANNELRALVERIQVQFNSVRRQTRFRNLRHLKLARSVQIFLSLPSRVESAVVGEQPSRLLTLKRRQVLRTLVNSASVSSSFLVSNENRCTENPINWNSIQFRRFYARS